MTAGKQTYLDHVGVRVIPAHLLPVNTFFRYKKRWWKKISFHEGVDLISERDKVQFLPTNFVLVRKKDVPNAVFTNCIDIIR